MLSEQVAIALNGIAWGAVALFVWMIGVETDLRPVWSRRKESFAVVGLALLVPFVLGALAALALLAWRPDWIGAHAQPWQFVAGIGMGCSITALPILALFLERLEILRSPLGQRLLHYASFDNLLIWAVLALILLDRAHIGRQMLFLAGFVVVAWLFRRFMQKLTKIDRWSTALVYVALVWLAVCSFLFDRSGLHFMVGAFLSGAFLDASWFNRKRLDQLRDYVLFLGMPVYFVSAGLRITWTIGVLHVFLAATLLLAVGIAGKLLGVSAAGRILGWSKEDARMIGWLLQTKGLIEVIFANILLDKGIIANEMFAALLLMAVVSTMLSMPIPKKTAATPSPGVYPGTTALPDMRDGPD